MVGIDCRLTYSAGLTGPRRRKAAIDQKCLATARAVAGAPKWWSCATGIAPTPALPESFQAAEGWHHCSIARSR